MYLRRIGELEQRVKVLEKDKAAIAGQFDSRLNKLVEENQRLIELVKDLEEEKKVEGKEEEQEFNVEEMLEQQININLGLREELEATKSELQQAKEEAVTAQQTIQ